MREREREVERTTITQPVARRREQRAKSGSDYKVIRLKLMVNKATTPCLVMKPLTRYQGLQLLNLCEQISAISLYLCCSLFETAGRKDSSLCIINCAGFMLLRVWWQYKIDLLCFIRSYCNHLICWFWLTLAGQMQKKNKKTANSTWLQITFFSKLCSNNKQILTSYYTECLYFHAVVCSVSAQVTHSVNSCKCDYIAVK